MDLNFSKILKKGVNSMLLQGLSILITLLLNWYLANELGAKEYGIFTYAFSWVYLFGTLSMLGLDSVLQRELVRLNPNNINRLVVFTRKLTFGLSIIVTIVFALIVYIFNYNIGNQLSKAMIVAIAALPLFTQLLVSKNICLGLKKVEFSILPESIFRPVFILIGIVLISTFFFNVNLKWAIILNVGAILLALFFSFLFTKNKSEISENLSPTNKSWFSLGITFFLLTATTAINSRADILMLGMLGYTDKVGVYNIAVKLSALIALPLFILNKIIAPYISQFFKTQQKELALIVKKFTRIIFILGLIGFSILYVFGTDLLNYFGDEFKAGYFVLLLLSAGQLLNLFVGPVGNTLRMSNLEKTTLKSMILSSLINIILNITLIPVYNINGAAIATFSSLIFWNIHQSILVKKKLKMNISVI